MKKKKCALAGRHVDARADFVKTSTGFSTSGATIGDVELMRREVGREMGVKASGGVRTLDDLLEWWTRELRGLARAMASRLWRKRWLSLEASAAES